VKTFKNESEPNVDHILNGQMDNKRKNLITKTKSLDKLKVEL